MQTNNRSPEKILLTGDYGSGKSNTWGNIAQHLVETKNKLYLGNTDPGRAERQLDAMPEIEEVVTVAELFDWDDFTKWGVGVRVKALPGDWVVLDMADRAWTAVQEAFAEKAFGKNIGDWFLEAAKAGTMGAISGDHGVNWGVINRMYNQFMVTNLLRVKAHLLILTPSESLSEAKANKADADKEYREEWGRFGVKPAGQKRLPYQCHTILYMQQAKNRWVMNTVRDVKREIMRGKEVRDFCKDYLADIAGWTV